jgi:shikimate dehydrogenase
MMNAAFAAMGLDWRYLAFDVELDDLREAILGANRLGFVGLNLTAPHKTSGLALVDLIDDSAERWGSVNTIRFEQDAERPARGLRARGLNTDVEGLMRSLAQDLGFRAAGASVVVLGAGGAGRMAALRLASEGIASLYVINRTPAKVVEVEAEVRERFPNVQFFPDLPEGPVDLVVNATSLGLRPEDPLPFDFSTHGWSPASMALDLNYQPSETPFLAAAKAAGCRTANGLGMLLHQGAVALELWTGRPAPVDVMRRALEKHIYGT